VAFFWVKVAMRKLLMLAVACSIIGSGSVSVLAQSVFDSCKVSLIDMVDDDVTDIGTFNPEIGADKLTNKAYRIPSKIKSKWSFVTVGVFYSNSGIPKDSADIDDINFIVIASKKPFRQAPDLSLESALFSDFDGSSTSVPMKSFDRVEVSKNIIGRDGRLLIVSLECERKTHR
jgi:hypothetical protein